MARKKRSSPRASFDARDRSPSPAPANILGSPLGGASNSGTSPSARTHAHRRGGKQPDLDLTLAMQSLALSAPSVSSPLTPRARRDSGRRNWSDLRAVASPPPPLNLQAGASSPRTPSGTQWTVDGMDDEFGLASPTPRRSSRRSRRTSGQLGTPPTPTPTRRGGGAAARNTSPPPSPLLSAAHMVDTDSDALDNDEDVVLATAAQRRRKAEQRKRKQQRKQQQQQQQVIPAVDAADPVDHVEVLADESSSDDSDRDELDFMHAQLQILCPWYLPVFDATRPMSKRALATFAAVRTSRTGFVNFDGLVPEGDTEAARAAAIDAEDALGVAMADQVPGSPVAAVTSVIPEAAGATLATAGAWCRYPSALVPPRRARSPPPRLRLPRVAA
ncbi:hypothetical protein GGF31_000435 [Allomyces arbusculus]|nr:hypothetical protein GGF31_000435 [Allomyces arbusculus]